MTDTEGPVSRRLYIWRKGKGGVSKTNHNESRTFTDNDSDNPTRTKTEEAGPYL